MQQLKDRRRRRRGIFVVEMLAGLTIMVAVATLLAVTLTRRAAASQRLAETRAAQRLAESVLLDLQSHRAPAAPTNDPSVRVDVQPVSDMAAVGDSRWVRVEVTHAGRHTSLVGLVSKDATTQPAER